MLACAECGRPAPQWSGRCPGCGAWGSIAAAPKPVPVSGRAPAVVSGLLADREPEARLATGLPGLDRVLGGGLVPGSVVLLAGEPGIGKSTLVLQAVAGLAASGHRCLVASGEESAGQVAARARRLGVAGDGLGFVAGRELEGVVDAARAERPALLVIDSVQTVRAEGVAGIAGGVAQVRACADVLVGLAKAEGVAVLLVGHVTKDGDLAGPRTLEHAVDTILAFSGDPRSGLRTLASGKNRFGAEGEVAWFEMGGAGLAEIDPAGRLLEGQGEAGAAVALCLAGRRAVAVEIQGLVVTTEGPPRRQVSGLDGRRFGMVGAVLEQARLLPPRAELYGASAGGLRVDDPGTDLALAAALASAASGRPPPAGAAFVGEVALTGTVRLAAGMALRLSAARAAGIETIYAPAGGPEPPSGVRIRTVRTLRDALSWTRSETGGSGGKKGL